MIYAVSDTRGKWVILRGWHGCLSGQGSVLETDVDDKEVNNRVDKYRTIEDVMTKSDLRIEAERQVSGLPSRKVNIMSEYKEETIHDKIRDLIEEYLKKTGVRVDSISFDWYGKEYKTIREVKLNSTKTRWR